MNQTGCPPNIATDEILHYENAPLACDLQIPVWISCSVIVILLYFSVAAGQCFLWVRRKRLLQARIANSPTQQHLQREAARRPVVPTLGFLMGISQLVSFCLSVANIQGGVIAFFYGLGWTFFGLLSLLFLLKFVSLGHRIAPRNMLDSHHHAVLNKFDTTGSISFSLCLLSLFGQFLCFCVLGPIFPQSYLLIQIANGCNGWFLTQLTISLNQQIYRVKQAIISSRNANVGKVSTKGAESLNRALNKMTNQQAIISSFSLISVIFYILVAAKVVIMTYYVVLIPLFIAGVTLNGVLYTNLREVFRSKKDTETSAVSSGKENVKVEALEVRMTQTDTDRHKSGPLSDPQAAENQEEKGT